MQDSHTAASVAETAAGSSALRLVPTATMGLPERLAGRVDEHLAAFAAHMTQGLLAASTAVGLEVMGELLDVEVAGLAGPRASTTRSGWRCATAASRARSPLAGGGLGCADRGCAPPARPPARCSLSPTPRSPRPTCWPRGSWLGCWRGCQRGATRPGWSRSARLSSRPRRARRSRRSRAGLWRRPPSGWPSCWPAGWMTGAGWWCSWTGSGWASTCWSARWASPTTAPRFPWG